MSAFRIIRFSAIASRPPSGQLRQFSIAPRKLAEGDTGSVRARGQVSGDGWTRREKAAEDLYIKGREKAIVQLLKEKIAKQEEQLAKDRAMLAAMEDQYGNAAEG